MIPFRGLASKTLTARVFCGIVSSFLCLLVGLSGAFEKWERELGWNPLFGPRYVVFWGSPAGYREPRLGTCTLDHFATSSLPGEPPFPPFEDRQVTRNYDDGDPNPTPNPPEWPLINMSSVPFYESSPAERYTMLKESQLPFETVQDVPRVVMAAKAIVGEICMQFLETLQPRLSDTSAFSLLVPEAARLLKIVESMYQLVQKSRDHMYAYQAAEVFDILEKMADQIRRQPNWDANKYIYWLDAANTKTEDGETYYVPDMEASLWKSAVFAASAIQMQKPGYGETLSSLTTYKDCSHFLLSKRASTLMGRESFCQDAFTALTRVLLNNVGKLDFGTEGQKSVNTLLQAIRQALAQEAAIISKNSPFFFEAAEAGSA